MFRELLETIMLEASVSHKGGWVHPDGELEEFSSYGPGIHEEDAFRKLVGGELKSWDDRASKSYYDYLEKGNIRYVQESEISDFNVGFIKKPTASQMLTLGRKAREEVGFHFQYEKVPTNLVSGSSWEEFREFVNKM